MKIPAFSLHSALAVGICAVSFASAAEIPTARADDTFFYGQWKIVGAQPAPWIEPGGIEPGKTPDGTDYNVLIGKTIGLSAKSVSGPGDFPCGAPKYEILRGGPDMLFQGTFGEMHDRDKNADPRKLAEQVGFTGTAFRTVVTGCAYEVDFSFDADDDTAKFGLNDYVYTLKRE